MNQSLTFLVNKCDSKISVIARLLALWYDKENTIRKEVKFMSGTALQALHNAAASSEMEGLPLQAEHLEIIQNILAGKITLQDFFRTLQEKQEK